MNQSDFAILGETQKPETVPEKLIERCNSLLQSVKLCIQYSHHSYETVREYLNIDKGNFSRMMNGSVNLPLKKIPALMFFCGNLAILQYLAREMGYGLIPLAEDKDGRIAALEARLAHMEDRRYG